jgi:hypothetical protein
MTWLGTRIEDRWRENQKTWRVGGLGRCINMCIFLWRPSRRDCLFRILASQDLSRIMGVLSAYLGTKKEEGSSCLSLSAETIR